MRFAASACILLNVLVLGLFAVRRIEVVVMEIQVILADANPGVRAALRSALEQRSAYRVTAEVGDVIHLLAYVVRDCPDVLILNPDLPGITPGKLSGSDSLAEVIGILGWFCPRIRRVAFYSRSNHQKWCENDLFDRWFRKGDSPDVLIKWMDSEFFRVETKSGMNAESCAALW